jgi:hypothetical protein
MFCDKLLVPAEIAVYSPGITLYDMRGFDVLLFGRRHSYSGFRRNPKRLFGFYVLFAYVVRGCGCIFTICVGVRVLIRYHKEEVVVSYRYVRQGRDFRIARWRLFLRRNGTVAFDKPTDKQRMQSNHGKTAFGRRGILVGYVRR